jgi:hypothetical protein
MYSFQQNQRTRGRRSEGGGPNNTYTVSKCINNKIKKYRFSTVG